MMQFQDDLNDSSIWNFQCTDKWKFQGLCVFNNNAEPGYNFGRETWAGQLRHDDQACLELHRPGKSSMEIPSHLILQDPMELTLTIE